MLLLVPAIGAAVLLRQTSLALRDAKAEIRSRSELAFSRTPYRPISVPSAQLFNMPAEYESAAFLGSNMCLSGHGGLFCHADGQGHAYLPGIDLPPQPMGVMVEATLRAEGASKLYIASGSDGLVIFDGKRFELMRPQAPEQRHAVALLALASGRLLIGSEKGGVLLYDGQRLSPLHAALSKLQVTALAGDESELWIGTRHQGAFRFTGGHVQQFQAAEGLPDPQVLSLAVSGDTAAVGTPVGVALFHAGHFERVMAASTFARCLLLNEGTMQIGTQDSGIITLPLSRQDRNRAAQTSDTPDGEVRTLIRHLGKAYAVTASAVWEAAPQADKWTLAYQPPQPLLADRNVSAIAPEAGGRLWVGYFDHGLDLVDASAEHARHIEDDQIYCVNRIAPGTEGRPTAVATLNGLVLLDGSGARRQLLNRSTGVIANQIADIFSEKGRMIVATSAGLTFLDGQGARSLYAFHGLVNNHTGTLAQRRGQILVGTLGGLSLIEGETIKVNYTTANSQLKHNWVTAIASDESGWWIGTYGAGVTRLDEHGDWQTEPGLPPGVIVNPNALVATKSAIYAGSLGHGLLVYSRSLRHWEQRSVALPSLNVTALAERQGDLYIGTDNGMVKLAERNLLQ